MAAQALSGNFVFEFKARLRDAQKVQIASAWLSESGALDALLRKRCRVQAIIGVNGNSTSPESVSSLARRFGWANLRIPDRQGPLFHPKLFIFHYSGARRVAWIGSANFTGHGMEVNKELVLQIDDKSAVDALCKWFDREWASAPSNPKQRLDSYVDDRDQPHQYEGDRGGVPKPTAEEVAEMEPQRARYLMDLRERDKYKFKYFGEDRWASSLREIAENVLVAFANADSGFLERLAREDRTRLERNKRAKRRFLSQDREKVGVQPPDRSLPGGWWMPQHLNDYQFFGGSDGNPGVLRMACDVLGVSYEDGDAGPVDFQRTHRRKPRGYDEGRVVVVRVGKRAERGGLGLEADEFT